MVFNNKQIVLSNVDIDVTIIHNLSKVKIIQTFINNNEVLTEAEYNFPIYAAATLTKCKFTSGENVTKCVIKEKEEAKKEYEQARDDGLQSVLLSSNSNELMVMNIASLQPKIPIIVELEYVTTVNEEYGYDDDTYRFILPMTISNNRYSNTSASVPKLEYGSNDNKLNITVRLDSTHKIINNKKVNVSDYSIEYKNNDILITYAENDINLSSDFILLYSSSQTNGIVEKLNNDKNIIFHKLNLKSQEFYPKLLDSIDPSDNIFIIDQSGSMGGSPIKHAKNALKILVKSLNVKDTFNIYGFGSRFNSLFKESIQVDNKSIKLAINHINNLSADLGGTEITSVFVDVFKKLSSKPTKIFILTDGEVWPDDTLTKLLKDTKKDNLYISALGIGNSVNHDLLNAITKNRGHVQYALLSENIELKTVELFNETNILNNIKITSKIGETEIKFVNNMCLTDVDCHIGELLEYTIEHGDDTYDVDVSLINRDDDMLHCLYAKNQIDTMTSDKNNKDQIIELSKKYNILSEYTSFIGVNNNDFIDINNVKQDKVTVPMFGGLTLGNSLVCSSASQLNYVDFTVGSTSYGKALVLDANKNITGINGLSSTNLTGMLQNTPQPNITSVGTLTSLKVGRGTSKRSVGRPRLPSNNNIRGGSAGAVFKCITNDGKQDNLLEDLIRLERSIMSRKSRSIRSLTKKDIIELLSNQNFDGTFDFDNLKDFDEVFKFISSNKDYNEFKDIITTYVIILLMRHHKLDTKFYTIYNKAMNVLNTDYDDMYKKIDTALKI